MQFRVRPSSKRSNNNDGSLIQFPTSKSLYGDNSPLPRSLGARIDQLQAVLSSFQDLHKRQREMSNVSYLDVQKRLDRVEYKVFAVQQDVRQLGDIREIQQPRERISLPGGDTSKNEVILLKQVVLQEKQAQRDMMKHQNSMIEQLQHKQLRQEQEIRELIAQQRMEWEHRMNGQGEQLREIEGLKQRKMQQQYQMMKGVISNAQRKIYEELQRKIKNQTVVKDFVEDRISSLKEELHAEHRQTLATEAKFIKQTKQSLQTLFALANNIKKELSDDLAQTQKLTTSSIKRLSMSLDIARQKSTDQLKQIAGMNQQASNQLVELRNFVTARLEENRQIMNEFQQQTLQRIEGGNSSQRSSEGVDSERLSLFQKEINHWKSITEQKNLNVFKQISNTLKAMKLQWRKQNDELVSEVAALNESLKNLKKTGPSELKKSVQALVSIFNNQFDVLAEQLETLTDMIALAKKQNQKVFKEEIIKVKAECYEQIKNAVAQKGKQNSLYTDKAISRSEENQKISVAKQIKFASDALTQRIQKNETSTSQLQTSMKKNSLLTTAQLQDYSLKIKNFNDNYKEYLQQQRKEDMRKRIQLEDTMRKNASNLMDICYKKSQFLVQGLKNNLQVAQMKEKVEATQALDVARDELKKQIQTARQEWQKQLVQNGEKITKERQNSEQVLHEALQQSINNAKRNLSNEIGNNKLQVQQKINEMKVKQVQKEADQQQKQVQLKNTLFQMLRDEKRLTQENLQKIKLQIQNKLIELGKNQQNKQLEVKNRQSAQKKDIQFYVAAQISKLDTSQKEEINKNKLVLEQQIKQHKSQINLRFSRLEEDSKKSGEQKIKSDQQSKSKESQLEKKVELLNQNIETRIKSTDVKIDQLIKKLASMQNNVEQQKAANSNDGKIQDQLDKKIIALSQDIQLKNKTTSDKIDLLNKKTAQLETNNHQKEGQGKKVGEQNLKQLKRDVEKSIGYLQARMQELQSKDKGQQNQESINTIRKSVNKLQAMVFSEQAKNKALFDRLTEDVNKVSQNLALITNQMRE